jgi:hypothetical protein
LLGLEDRWIPSFSPGVPYLVGAPAQAVVADDFNDDAFLDLATANAGTNTVSVLLGSSNGSFNPPLNSATGNSPASMAVGDFDEDGFLDVATGNFDNVSVLFGDGSGQFVAPENFSQGLTGHSVAVGDFNDDGNLDLAVTANAYIPGSWGYWGWYPGWFESHANVLIGNGAGSFTWGASTFVGTSYSLYTQAMAVADFNSDGRDDLVVALPESAVSAVLLAGAGGSFGGPSYYDAGGYANAVAAGDVNGDSRADLIAGTGIGVTVRLGNGLGGFGNAAGYPTGGTPYAIALGDFNAAGGDGNPDIAVANYTGNGLAVLLGTGTGAFKPPLSPASESVGSTDLTTGDFDGDGWLDAARTSYTSPGLETFRNDLVWPALDAPSLSIADVEVVEGHDGTVTASFVVTLSSASSQPVTVAYRTSDLDATAGSDYQARTGTITFAPNQTSQPVEITVHGDRVPEWTEYFQVRLSDSVNAFLADATAWGRIVDDEPTVSITGDVGGPEGNSGSSNLTFTLTLSQSYGYPVTVQFATADFTWEDEYWYGPGATAGVDYIARSGSVTFDPGQTTQTVDVQVIGDRLGEWDERFWFMLTGADSAHLGTSWALGVIENDEPYVSIDYSSLSIIEGDAGTKTMSFTVSLSARTDVDVTVDYTTNDGSALAGSDYLPRGGTLTIPAGQSSKTIDVPVIGDRVGEMDEYFSVSLANASGATLGNATGYGYVQDNEPRISIASPPSIAEGNSGTKPLVFTVTLSAAYDQTVTVNYSTYNGSAVAGQDYVATSGTLTFGPNETSRTFTVLIKGDKQKESDEWFGIELSGASVNSLIWNGYADGVIKNDDGGKGKK